MKIPRKGIEEYRKLDKKKYKDASKKFDKLKQNDNQGEQGKFSKAGDTFKKLNDAANQIRKALQNQNESNSDLSDDAMDLADAVDDLDEMLQEADPGDCENGDCDMHEGEPCQWEAGEKVNVQLVKLVKDLDDMDAQKKLFLLMDMLRKKLGHCQSYLLNGNRQSLSKSWGRGTDDRKNDQDIPKTDEGKYARLPGVKGKGPSQIQVLDTGTGSGVSRLRPTRRSTEFKKQVESFIQREDVPEDVKSGVKKYFETIHQVPEEASK